MIGSGCLNRLLSLRTPAVNAGWRELLHLLVVLVVLVMLLAAPPLILGA